MTRRRPQSCARPTGFAPLGGRRDPEAAVNERSSTHTNNQHGMGPVQGSGLGPLQVAAPNQLFELAGYRAGVRKREQNLIGGVRRSTLLATYLALDQVPQRDTDRCGAQAGAAARPYLVADLHPRHAVALRLGLSRGPFSTQSRSLARVNAVYDASPDATVCCERSGAERQGCLCGQPGGLTGRDAGALARAGGQAARAIDESGLSAGYQWRRGTIMTAGGSTCLSGLRLPRWQRSRMLPMKGVSAARPLSGSD